MDDEWKIISGNKNLSDKKAITVPKKLF